MKRFALISALILICMTAAPSAFGQKGCEFNIVGTWKAEKPDEANPVLYRFTPDARVAVLSRSGQSLEPQEIASAAYTLDNPKSPKVILVKSDKAVGGFPEGTTSMEIKKYDDLSVTFVKPGSEPTRWIRVDPYKYFLVLAGRIGTFYDGSGPTFPMVIKTDGRETQIDAVGIFPLRGRGYWSFGTIPQETYKEFMKESRKDSEVMLRLEITAAQYERNLKIIKTWERRARNKELLYPDETWDNILLAKQVTESLNLCGEKVKLYNLDWTISDQISSSSPTDDNEFSRIPFKYFRELKKLNQALHVPDEKFYEYVRPAQKEAGQ
jgi:hypothetical protein